VTNSIFNWHLYVCTVDYEALELQPKAKDDTQQTPASRNNGGIYHVQCELVDLMEFQHPLTRGGTFSIQSILRQGA
jgi:hypothetical protein